ncbi:hypothetical protein BS47DRAFT_1389512 [Hydnum rufescens UP504]|uniref:Uncharacterized protein n=1 Tax=Hydnum rufescens UP504 TaxID=1448309 RepID=A0A9P6E130_9AGAM|nr:hypothetical protein BS47DRAFT_1389512 [Hydnum rufescens UP504]
MPPKPTKRSKPLADESEWQELGHTSGSGDSDDGQQAYLELFMKIEADKVKKKKQQELQLLATTRKNLDTLNERETMLAEYTEIEENIKVLWGELLEEQERFLTLCETQQAEFHALQEERDERYDAALRSMKSACLGMYCVMCPGTSLLIFGFWSNN